MTQTTLTIQRSQPQIKTWQGVSIVKVIDQTKENWPKITFSNGKTVQYQEPYSRLPIYTFDVECQEMKMASDIVKSMVPFKKRMDFGVLEALVEHTKIAVDMDGIMFGDEEHFDATEGAPDQMENLKTHYPEIIELLEGHHEGLFYLFFDALSVLSSIYGTKALRELTPTDLKKLAIVASSEPAYLAFKVTIPNRYLPELSLEQYEVLRKALGKSINVSEKAAISLYNTWLKMERDQYGNLYSMVGDCTTKHVFGDDGMTWLVEHKIVTVECDRFVVLADTLESQNNIKENFAILRQRFEQQRGNLPLRDHIMDPYEKKSSSKTLTKEQEDALNLLQANSIALLNGPAGTGKCLSPLTPITMYDGSIKIAKEIRQGDRLMGDDGTARLVLSTTKGTDEMYEIIPNKGSSFICNEPHILTLKSDPPNISTFESDGVLRWKVTWINRSRNDMFFDNEELAINFANQIAKEAYDIPLDEYMKRPSFINNSANLFHAKPVYPKIDKILPVDPYRYGYYWASKKYLDVKDLIPSPDVIINAGENIRMLSRLNASVRSRNFVRIYKYGSEETRMQVLAGIIDFHVTTNGAGHPSCHIFENVYACSSANILALSLGFMSHYKDLPNTDFCLLEIESDRLHEIPTRKLCFERSAPHDHLLQKFTIKRLGKGNYCGFTLDGNGRFLLGDFLVTHNTTIQSHLAEKYAPKTVMACAPTNRAARVLTKKVLPSFTIHRLIAGLINQEVTFHAEEIRILLIDEASMIPERLFSILLDVVIKRCPNICAVYAIGDSHQLDAIGAGAFFSTVSDHLPTAKLITSHRVTKASKIIYENSIKIRNKRTDLIIDQQCFSFEPCAGSLYEGLEAIIEKNPDMNAWNSHAISPYREEARNISHLLKQIFTGNPHVNNVLHRGDKILCTKNHLAHDIVNGDFFRLDKIFLMEETFLTNANGQIQRTVTKKGELDNTYHVMQKGEFFEFSLVLASFTEEERKEMEMSEPFSVEVGKGWTKLPMSSFTLGYCTTNHQFQGCEADNIIFDIRKNSTFVNNKQVYTAVTRPKSRLISLGTLENMITAITRPSFPKKNRLLEHLDSSNDFLKTLPQRSESVEEYLQFLFREIAVSSEDDGWKTDANKKRDFQTSNN